MEKFYHISLILDRNIFFQLFLVEGKDTKKEANRKDLPLFFICIFSNLLLDNLLTVADNDTFGILANLLTSDVEHL